MSETLTFSIPSAASNNAPHKIHLHQSSSIDEDQGLNETNTGFVMWPSAVMLAHHLSKNPSIVLGGEDKPDGDVMELGAGCGLVGLTAATLLQNDGDDDKVIFTDYNPAVLDNLQKNIDLNEFDVDHKVLGLDWFDQELHQEQQQLLCNVSDGDNNEEKGHCNTMKTWVDVDGKEHAQVRLILGADLLVCTNDADLVASTIQNALIEGGSAFILGADAYTRFGVRNFPAACRSLGLTVTVHEDLLDDSNFAAENVDGEMKDQQLMDELELGGYNQRASTMGHDFTMFTVRKPIVSSA